MFEGICRLMHFINNTSKDTFEAPQNYSKSIELLEDQIQNTRHQYILQEGEGKVFPLHAMKTFMGSIGIAPLSLNLGTRWS
jgi:hypothetical protein